MENGQFIDDLPINSMVIFHGYVSHSQRVPKKPLNPEMLVGAFKEITQLR